MVSFTVRLDLARMAVLKKRAEQGSFRSLGHAAASIRATARRLVVRSRKAAPPGESAHTRGRGKRGDAILFAVDRDREVAVIGFTHAVFGEAMSAHEHGGAYMGDDFPQRPTMGPALDVNIVRFADEFRGSIGE